jgi:hypothetical protein
MSILPQAMEERLTNFAGALIDQVQARTLVPPQQASSGFWFGGGNMIEDEDGTLHVVGRYRNHGDSRTGLAAGERGLELAVFSSGNDGETWDKTLSLSKSDLDLPGRCVLSIEGSALHKCETGIELFVSTEKDDIGYPTGFADHLKPGTGVWTIERLAADSIAGLKDAQAVTVLQCNDPRWLHVKDPFVYDRANGDLVLLFCSHPYCWSSSNTGHAIRRAGESTFSETVYDFFPRGFTWDVAMTRGTCVLDVPAIGAFQETSVSLMFYDGGESLRNLDEHTTAVPRPRGYSCEEIGGAAYLRDGNFSAIERLSKHQPLFVSPMGTGCSRYVDVLQTRSGDLIATWQQSQHDGSQPLVMHRLNADKVVAPLS